MTDTAAVNKKIKELYSIAKSHPDSAFNLAINVLEASERLNYPQGIFYGNSTLGYLLKRSEQPVLAKMRLKKCVSLIHEYPDIKYTSSIYILLANIYNMQSEFDSCLIFERKARAKALLEGDTTNYIKCLNNASITYRYLGMWDSSLIVLKENERIIRLKKDTVRLGTCLHLQAIILQKPGTCKNCS